MGSVRWMGPIVIRYAVREVRLENGERFPLLVYGDPVGLPVPDILEYTLAKLRARGLRRASIRHRIEALGLRVLFAFVMWGAQYGLIGLPFKPRQGA
ncbi:hypothetical protein [Burkholderia metallica]